MIMANQSATGDLSSSLHVNLSPAACKVMLKRCWGVDLTVTEFERQYDLLRPYFHNYETLCKNRSINTIAKLEHRDILRAFELIKFKTRKQCVSGLQNHLQSITTRLPKPKNEEEFVNEWINHTGESLFLLSLSDWKDNETLKSFLENRHFLKSKQSDDFRISSKFNARNLNHILGLTIRWTSILSEHMSLEHEDSQIVIFHQRFMLGYLADGNIFPDDMLNETRRTLDVLFPRYDEKSKKFFRYQMEGNWFKRLKGKGSRLIGEMGFKTNVRQSRVDRSVAISGSLRVGDRNIKSFPFFGDRLIVLKEEYDSHDPQSISQYWYDYRKPAQWWAFWAAVVIFVFGTVQVIEGAIQCYKAYYPS